MLFNRHKAPRALVEQAQALQQTEDIRIGSWQLDHLPSLNFYARRDVTSFAQEAEVVSFLRYTLPVYVFMPADEWQRLCPSIEGFGRVVAQHPDMYKHSDIVVVTNR